MQHEESREQIALFQWISLSMGRYPELQTAYAIPNGGLRGKREAAIMKAEGVKAGVSDICLPVARGPYHSLYIELKAPGAKNKKGSPAQREWIDLMRKYGNYAFICIGWEEARKTIEAYLKLGVRTK